MAYAPAFGKPLAASIALLLAVAVAAADTSIIARTLTLDNAAFDQEVGRLASTYPKLVRASVLTNTESGTPIRLLTVTEFASGEKKPGYFIQGNIHSKELSGTTVSLRIAELLAQNHRPGGILSKVVYYIVPRCNPDGAQRMVKTPGNERSAWGELSDEEGMFEPKDLDGDGLIAQMVREDPDGGLVRSPRDPRCFVLKAEHPEIAGPTYTLCEEGVYTNWKGRPTKKPWGRNFWRRYIDYNRNWEPGWKRETMGAGLAPYDNACTRSQRDFILAHTNIVGATSVHNGWGMVFVPPVSAKDREKVMALCRRGSELSGFPVRVEEETNSVNGEKSTGFFTDFCYSVGGFVGITWEVGTRETSAGVKMQDLIKRKDEYSAPFEVLAMEDALPAERRSVLPWKKFDHPQLGPVEIGGINATRFGNPLEEDLERTTVAVYRFVIEHAESALPPPRLGKLHVMWGTEGLDLAKTTAERRVHRMAYDRDILRFDAPWEGDGCGDPCFIVDQDEKGTLYRFYYLCWSVTDVCAGRPGATVRTAYMESRDGVNWVRPELGQVEFRGSKKNNLLDCGMCNYFFKDTNPTCPPDQLYKATTPVSGPRKADGTADYFLRVYASADGIRFRPLGDIIAGSDPYMKFDTKNVIFYDNLKGVYRAYVRGLHDQTDKSLFSCYYRYIRTNFVSESKDFKTWSKPVPLNYQAGAEDVNIYTPATHPYFRDPSLYVGLPSRYLERRDWTDNLDNLSSPELRRARMRIGEGPRHGMAFIDTVFMFSRNGVDFERSEEAVMTPGPETDPRSWVYGSCYPSSCPILVDEGRGGDKLMAFFQSDGHWFGAPKILRRFTLRQDGFASRHAGIEEKTVVTTPVVCDGGDLYINFATSSRGHVFVTLTGPNGETLKSCELFGDRVDRKVRLTGGELGALKGKNVTLTFRLLDADLYSYRFAD